MERASAGRSPFHTLLNPWLQAAAGAALALAVYVRTLAPSVMWYDMGEFATAAYVLGIAHNTGYPLLMLLGKLFTYLPVGDIAYRVNLMSAVFAALTVLLSYIIVFELTARRGAALVAALTLAFTSTLWSNATWATSYDLNAFLTLLILWLILRWRRTRRLTSLSANVASSQEASKQSTQRYLYAAALVFGLIFYILTTFIIKVDIHFIHIWGIEFVLNMIIMLVVSHFYPGKVYDYRTEAVKIDMKSWRYTRHFSIVLVVITILIYILLGR